MKKAILLSTLCLGFFFGGKIHAQLPGDVCQTAIPFQIGATLNGTIQGYQPDFGLPPCGTPGTEPGVFYTFTAPNNGTATVSLCGSQFDTKLSIYSGTCNGLQCIAQNDNFCGLQSQVGFPASTGVSYFVYIRGIPIPGGSYVVHTNLTVINTGPPVSVTTPACMKTFTGYEPLQTPVRIIPTITGGTAPFSYFWKILSGGRPVDGVRDNYHEYLDVSPPLTTTYGLTVTDANGNTASSSTTVNVVDLICGNKKGKGNKNKIAVCHTPPSHPGQPKTECVGPSKLAKIMDPKGSHFGDYQLGPCDTSICLRVVTERKTKSTTPTTSTPDSIRRNNNPANPKIKIGDVKRKVRTDSVYVIDKATGDTLLGYTIDALFVEFVPVNGISLDSAAKANGQDHFNWYQVIDSTVGTNLPNGAGGQLTAPPPFADPPPGGFNGQGADSLPWYYEESNVPGCDPDYKRQNNEGEFSDSPHNIPGSEIYFCTWLVSLNADNSFHSWHSGFCWRYRNVGGNDVIDNVTDNPNPPTPAQAAAGGAGAGFHTSGAKKWAGPDPASALIYSNEIYLTAYPNPFKEETVIEMNCRMGQHARLEVFTPTGNIIATLFEGDAEPGKTYSFKFNPGELANGIYYYRFVSATENKVGKLVFMR